jgi:hypothetical protein
MERKTIIRPGYDCRVKCSHDPPGNHGIAGDEWVFVVMDGERAVSLSILSNDYPPTVEREHLPDVLREPITGALAWHRYHPDGHDCSWVAGGKCEHDVSYLEAGRFWKEHAVGNQSEQPASFWLALEEELRQGSQGEGFGETLARMKELFGRIAQGQSRN